MGERRSRASGIDVCGDLFCGLAIEIGDQNVGAFLGETSCDPLAKPLSCACDDCGFRVEAHGLSP
jgi:hypothetical protein